VSWGDCIIAVAHLPAYQHEALHIFCPLNCREILKTSRVAAFLEFCFWLLARLRDGEWELMNAQGPSPLWRNSNSNSQNHGKNAKQTA